MRDDSAILGGHLIAIAGPLTVAGLMTSLRHSALGVTVVMFVLTVVIAAAASLGGPAAGVVATTCAALSTDFLYVEPYLDLKYRPHADLWPVLFIAVGGAFITMVAWRSHRRPAAVDRVPDRAVSPPSRHIERVALLAEQGVDVRDLISAVQAELMTLLLARSCRFEADDHDSGHVIGMPRLERNGTITGQDPDPALPPGELELPVSRGIQQLGRFIVDATPGAIVPLDHRIVAVVLTDHLAAAIVRRHPTVPPPNR